MDWAAWRVWYDALSKPAWTPSPQTISLIWWCLYPAIAVTFGYVLVQCVRGKFPGRVAVPFALNVVFNLAFMPIFVATQNNALAAADVAATWVTLAWAMVAAWPHAKWVALAQLPYLTWLTVATTLQLMITAMNAST